MIAFFFHFLVLFFFKCPFIIFFFFLFVCVFVWWYVLQWAPSSVSTLVVCCRTSVCSARPRSTRGSVALSSPKFSSSSTRDRNYQGRTQQSYSSHQQSCFNQRRFFLFLLLIDFLFEMLNFIHHIIQLQLRRMMFLILKELVPLSDNVIIMVSSLLKDMTGNVDAHRSNALRCLCRVIDVCNFIIVYFSSFINHSLFFSFNHSLLSFSKQSLSC